MTEGWEPEKELREVGSESIRDLQLRIAAADALIIEALTVLIGEQWPSVTWEAVIGNKRTKLIASMRKYLGGE